jgi:excinuclease ABC subunit C
VDEACEFLDGASRKMIEQVETEMQAAAARLDFERAASLRNLLEDLKRTTKPMTRFTRKALPSAIDPAKDLKDLADALGLHRPPELMECFDISNISNTHIVASMVRFRDGVPDRDNYRRFRITGTKGQNDFASMAEVVRRRYSRILRESASMLSDDDTSQESPMELAARAAKEGAPIRLPDLIIVDGGRGQLSSACAELQRLGLFEVPNLSARPPAASAPACRQRGTETPATHP